MFTIYLHTQFHMLHFSASLVTATYRICTVMLFYIIRQNYLNKLRIIFRRPFTAQKFHDSTYSGARVAATVTMLELAMTEI